MTKSTWKNIYNSNITESKNDINDINDMISSVSETTDFERNVRKKLNYLNGGKNTEISLNEVPLIYLLENQQNGGSNVNITDDISTEELERKLRDIFTDADATGQSLAQPSATGQSLAQPSATGQSLAQPSATGQSLAQPSATNVHKAQTGGDEDVPLIMATYYSDATSFSNTKSSAVDSSSTSDSY
jgi:hypothetical protein